MKETDTDAPAEPGTLTANVTSKLKLAGIALVVGLILFLLGLVPMWYQARLRTHERDAARRELRLSQLQNSLASAAIDARRGDYEPARQEASRFFTDLRAEVDKGDGSDLSSEQRGKIDPIFAGRDDVVTLLARNDPAAADRLSDMFAFYRKALAGTTEKP